jgi:pimeloyl-ACP methyl ester carboxylesterase
MVAAMDTPVLLSMYEADPAAELRKVRAPVLALFAEKDEIVSSDSAARARQVLAGHPDASVIEVAGANHGFQPVGAVMTKGEVPPAVSIKQVLDLVPPWLAARLRAR